jgi:uncharacterized protein (DUF58 family)
MLPVISYGLGMFYLRDLSFGRELPASGWDGETVEFQLVVRSSSRMARIYLEARDHLPAWLQPEESDAVVFSIPGAAVSRIPYRVKLLKRGAYKLQSVSVTALDPLGIFAFTRRFEASGEMLVYPVPEPISDIVLTGAERYGFRELPIAATRGSGIDPDGVREYVPGDPLRRVHWKSTARTGRLSVIEFEESRAVNVVLVLDITRRSQVGEGKESSFEYLVRVAASLAQAAIRQGASVRLVTGDDITPACAPGRGSDHLYSVLGDLARAEPVDDEPLSATLVERVGIVAPGTTLVLMTSGIDRGLAEPLSHLTADGAQVVVVYADPRSFDPSYKTGNDELYSFMTSLYAAKTAPFVLTANPGGPLRLESAQDARYFE